MDIRRVKEYLSWIYYQYQIISCCSVLEPWERSMFNTILLCIFAMVVYTAYVFIPIHIRLAWGQVALPSMNIYKLSFLCGYPSITTQTDSPAGQEGNSCKLSEVPDASLAGNQQDI
ncbi:PREDICTED: serine palmitoyltransferase small subunit B-like [Elephantulus edwardii]|uniref:serine palmitoyltransferase small subunit B-like n=1 Tax=Elephantulus edwardii TaxID=28737 RepID=UPI0003F0B3D4|nr:PREDICTED: serine palmitoyltransferase small subunit B-like [Elephantulus edwardii]